MDPIERSSDLAALSDRDVRRLLAEFERRRPGATVASAGVRPRRQPWTYRDIWELERLRAESQGRGLSG